MMVMKCKELIAALALLKICDVASLGGLLISVQHKISDGEQGMIDWKHACSGVLLHDNLALTCSSCVMFDNDGSFEVMEQNLLRVYSGDKDPDLANEDSNGQIVGVSSVVTHPDYRPSRAVEPVYDFGVVKTNKRFVLGSKLYLTPLYSMDVTIVKNRLETVGSKCKTMTWDFYLDGVRQNSQFQGIWMEVVFHAIGHCDHIRNDGTARMNQTFIIEEEGEDDFLMCAVSLQGYPICRMDPGSPVICEGKILAIVSNIGLFCERGSQFVVISGINNAMVFLTEPSSFVEPEVDSLEDLRTELSNNASNSAINVLVTMIFELIKSIILDS